MEIKIELPPIDHAFCDEFEKNLREEAASLPAETSPGEDFSARTLSQMLDNYGPQSISNLSLEARLHQISSLAAMTVAMVVQMEMVTRPDSQKVIAGGNPKHFMAHHALFVADVMGNASKIGVEFDFIQKSLSPSFSIPPDSVTSAQMIAQSSDPVKAEEYIGAALRKRWFGVSMKNAARYASRRRSIDISESDMTQLYVAATHKAGDRTEKILWDMTVEKDGTGYAYLREIERLHRAILEISVRLVEALANLRRLPKNADYYRLLEAKSQQLEDAILCSHIAVAGYIRAYAEECHKPFIPAIIVVGH